MSIESSEALWIESRNDYAIDELLALSGMPAPLLDELVASGALPVVATQATVRFEAECVVLVRAAQRLREHFELDDQGLAVAVSLLRKVRVLEAQVSRLTARFPAER